MKSRLSHDLKRVSYGFILASVSLFVLTGCGSSGSTPAPAPISAADAEKQIKAVQDNPNIPASAKQGIIDNIKKGQAQSK